MKSMNQSRQSGREAKWAIILGKVSLSSYQQLVQIAVRPGGFKLLYKIQIQKMHILLQICISDMYNNLTNNFYQSESDYKPFKDILDFFRYWSYILSEPWTPAIFSTYIHVIYVYSLFIITYQGVATPWTPTIFSKYIYTIQGLLFIYLLPINPWTPLYFLDL